MITCAVWTNSPYTKYFSPTSIKLFEADRPGLPCIQPLQVVTTKFWRNYLYFAARKMTKIFYNIFLEWKIMIIVGRTHHKLIDTDKNAIPNSLRFGIFCSLNTNLFIFLL